MKSEYDFSKAERGKFYRNEAEPLFVGKERLDKV